MGGRKRLTGEGWLDKGERIEREKDDEMGEMERSGGRLSRTV